MSGVMFAVLMLGLSSWAPARRHVVAIEQFAFQPAVVRVAVGDTIVWDNRDIVPHTATARNKSWDSGDIPAHGRRITIASTKGEQEFTCLYHSNMKGRLVVK